MTPFAIVGPTATGKTDLAIALAEGLNGEILVCDSMTVYRGMDIGTAKPTTAQRARVPHHLLDLAEPSEDFTVARYQQIARSVLDDVVSRGKQPIIVGGSGLYFRAIVDDLRFPPTDPIVRARIEEQDVDVLLQRLIARDPESAQRVDPGNKRRVVRALEVLELTGQPFSSFRHAWDTRGPCRAIGLDLPNGVADARIRSRLAQQLRDGLVEECARLRERGLSRTAATAIPYPDAFDLLDGVIDGPTFLERAAKANRTLARRQRTWFRSDPRVRWFDASRIDDVAADIKAYFTP